MKQELPTLNDLKMVELLAKHKSVRVVAEKLQVSPSTLSRQLGLLETRLGIEIFERNTRNLFITDSGKEFVQAAETVLDTMEEVMDNFDSHVKARKGRLCIAALPSTNVILAKLLSGFVADYPDIKLIISDQPSDRIIKSVNNGDTDLGLTAGTDALKKKLSFIPLFEDIVVAISAKSDKSVTKKSYKFRELIEFPLILSKKGNIARDLIEEKFGLESSEFAPRIEITHVATALSMVSEGLGITILPTFLLPAYRTENFKFHRVSELTKHRKLGIAYPFDRSPSPIASFFIKHARNEAKSLYQSILKEYPV